MPTDRPASIDTVKRDRSAELLRLALPLLSAHGSDFGPQSYALWYAYVAGGGAELAAALDAVVAARGRLSPGETQRLFVSMVLAGEGRALEAVRQALAGVMGGMSSAAADTRASSERFLRAIGAESLCHGAPADAGQGASAPAASRLADQARAMGDSLASLNARLSASQQQIEQLREQLERVRQESLTDALTRLANRRAFEDALERAIAEQAASGAPVSLVMLDVDHFKRVNDEFGHLFGDQVLRMIGQVLTANLKGKDTTARFGGEEFAVLLPGTPLLAAFRVADQLRLAVAATGVHGKGAGTPATHVTVSCGVAALAPGEDAAGLIGRADAALYEAKRCGRDRVAAAGDPG